MGLPRTIVIVGGVAGGASAATRARRMNEYAEIILLEKDQHVSFANCGLPYYLGGEIADRNRLLVATPEFLARRFRLDVRTRQEVLRIDRATKKVTVLNHSLGERYEQSYDKLILAPGASPILPAVEGVKSANVFTLRNLDDADRIAAAAAAATTKTAVVVGAGYVGLEMVEQLVRRGFTVTLAELQPQVLPLFDAEMVQPLQEELGQHGVGLHLGDGLRRILADSRGVAQGVELASGKRLDAAMVILAIGVRANLRLAQDAGLEIGRSGGIRTNRYLQTSDPDIYAVGDAAEYPYGPSGGSLRIALAGPANRAGRLAGEHAAADKCDPMSDIFGTAIVRVFEQVAAMTGLSSKLAQQLQRPARSVTVVANQHAGYYPDAALLTLKLVYDPQDGRLLGAQVIGSDGVDKRIDVMATAVAMGASVRQLAGLDLAYAPPFGSAKDPIHLAAFAACNQLDGIEDFLNADADLTGRQILDVRTADEVTARPLAGAGAPLHIPLDDLRDRLAELDPSADTVVVCGVGLRAHVAACILRQNGFQRVSNLSGGATLRQRAMAANKPQPS